ESGAYRMQRWWLKGGRAGRAEIFVDNLPGFPDNCSWNGRDRFWLALFAPRDALLDALAPRPFLRRMIARLPEFLRPKPMHHAFALGFDQDGRVVANLQDRAAEAYAPMTGAYEHGGWLYLSS